MHLLKSANFDIDHYLNRIVPPSPLPRFPTFVSRFLGYRKEGQQPDVGNLLQAWWSCVGAFVGLVVTAAVFNNIPSIQAHNPPTFIASFGASAVLEYNVLRSPLGQPRNAILGHTFSALIGVAITKLFQLRSDFENLRWIAGALSCGVASAVMLLTGTVHPPGGASAVLAATEPRITAMGWYFVGLVMFGTTIMVVVGLLVNNIQRQFPVYWWTPVDLRVMRTGKTGDDDDDDDDGIELVVPPVVKRNHGVHVTATGVSLPEDMSLNPGEVELLQNLRDRLAKNRDAGDGEESVPSTSLESGWAPRKESVSDGRRNSSSSAFQPQP